MRGTTNLEDLAACDIVIEAIIEQLPAKKDLYAAARQDLPAAHDFREQHLFDFHHGNGRWLRSGPERFVGLHFFNPVPIS